MGKPLKSGNEPFGSLFKGKHQLDGLQGSFPHSLHDVDILSTKR